MGETIEQLRDKLAGLMGWAPGYDGGCWSKHIPGPGFRATKVSETHPVTLSLDWLAAHGLPEGWRWWLLAPDNKDGNWEVTVQGGEDGDTLTGEAPAELHARLAACVAAWKAQAERSGT